MSTFYQNNNNPLRNDQDRSVSSQCWHLSIIFHIQLEIFSLGGTNEFSLFPRYDGYNIKIHWILFKSSVLVDFL